MKAIMMSIKPQHVANILNKIKTLEIRKRFPSDYVGWVYIYVTKDTSNGFLYKVRGYGYDLVDELDLIPPLNGKVVARFWCDKVEEIKELFEQDETMYDWNEYLKVSSMTYKEFLDKSCISERELYDYLKYLHYIRDIYGYAIHIANLEIFDTPKEIAFMRPQPIWKTSDQHYYKSYQITHAPQSWCYVEV